MWLLAQTLSRERPSPPCLQVTGVAADRRGEGPARVAIGRLSRDGQPGMYISRLCKGVWPGVTGHWGARKEEGEQDRHGLQGPLVLVMQGRFGCDRGDMLRVRNKLCVPRVEGGHVLETPSQKRGEGGSRSACDLLIR